MVTQILHPAWKFILRFLLIPIVLFSAPADIVIDSVTIHNDELCISYRSQLLDDRAITGLQNGFTSVALHQIFLWKRKGVFSKQVLERTYAVRLSFDRWDGKYLLESEQESRRTGSMVNLKRGCSDLADFPLCQSKELDEQAEYYISVNVTLQPVSAETYQELRSWLSRNRSSADSSKSGKPSRGQFFSLFLNVLGFGDRFYTAKSEYFKVIGRQKIEMR